MAGLGIMNEISQLGGLDQGNTFMTDVRAVEKNTEAFNKPQEN